MPTIKGGQISGGGTGIIKVTAVERIALSPTEGDVVYDLTIHSLFYFDGSSWVGT